MLCRRLPVLGRNGHGAGNEKFRRMDAATRRRGLSSPQIPLAAPEGGPRGAPPRRKTSTIIMRPPQQGHGGI